MKVKLSLLLKLLVLIPLLTACSYIKGLFPDKYKDYQFSTEIPALKLPAQLDNKKASVAEKVPEAAVEEGRGSAEPLVVPDATPTEATADLPKVFAIELVKFENGQTRLRIAAPLTKSWHLVSKALSRNGLEVSNRDEPNKIFNVHYDPNEQPFKDGTIFDEIAFAVFGAKGKEQELILKVVENDSKSEVIVLNNEGQPTSDDAALSLLKLIQETLVSEQTQ
ncbi:MAG: outer membrane protein assembly factor BamC [Methylococcaceae bacterium]|jgi:outer membrane protein assembly factor BamC